MIKLEHKVLTIDDMLYGKEDLINIIRLQKQLLIEEDTFFSIEECINIWQNYSWALSASWLFFPESDTVILKFIRNMDGFEGFEKMIV